MKAIPKTIVCTITNDISYDQRMRRICTSLSNAGYQVTLIGILRPNSIPLENQPYNQIRLKGIPTEGKLMYFLYWIKLFFKLLTIKADAFCAIDLDTILPVYWASVLRNKKRVYDAHELFTEMKEVVTRPYIKKMWSVIAKHCVPKFQYGYTIGNYYAQFLQEQYQIKYAIVRNATVLRPLTPQYNTQDPYILYQGAVNEGRCFEQLIPAMQWVDLPLIICGKGNFYERAVALAKQYNVSHKVIFKGYIKPDDLIVITRKATIGITLFEHNNTLSNYYSMANRFFDYMHNGIPQICNAYPEYIHVNEQFEIASLVEDVEPKVLATTINKLLGDTPHLMQMHKNALQARNVYCWQEEEKRLLAVYSQLFNTPIIAANEN